MKTPLYDLMGEEITDGCTLRIGDTTHIVSAVAHYSNPDNGWFTLSPDNKFLGEELAKSGIVIEKPDAQSYMAEIMNGEVDTEPRELTPLERKMMFFWGLVFTGGINTVCLSGWQGLIGITITALGINNYSRIHKRGKKDGRP